MGRAAAVLLLLLLLALSQDVVQLRAAPLRIGELALEAPGCGTRIRSVVAFNEFYADQQGPSLPMPAMRTEARNTHLDSPRSSSMRSLAPCRSRLTRSSAARHRCSSSRTRASHLPSATPYLPRCSPSRASASPSCACVAASRRSSVAVDACAADRRDRSVASDVDDGDDDGLGEFGFGDRRSELSCDWSDDTSACDTHEPQE